MAVWKTLCTPQTSWPKFCSQALLVSVLMWCGRLDNLQQIGGLKKNNKKGRRNTGKIFIWVETQTGKSRKVYWICLKCFCCFLTHISPFLVLSIFDIARMSLYYKDAHQEKWRCCLLLHGEYMDGFASKRLLQMAWSSEIDFSEEIVLSILSLLVKQLTQLTLELLGRIGLIPTWHKWNGLCLSF